MVTGMDLVEVVARALEAHTPNVSVEWCTAEGCEWNVPWGTATPRERKTALHAHRAAAVIEALTEAGTVEWGVRWGDGAWTGHLTQEQAKDLARGPGVESIISRLTFPWTAVGE